MKNENNLDNYNDDLFDESDDLMSLFDDEYSDSYDENQESDMDETDEELLALLGMISGQDETKSKKEDSLMKSDTLTFEDSLEVDKEYDQEDFEDVDDFDQEDIFAIDDFEEDSSKQSEQFAEEDNQFYDNDGSLEDDITSSLNSKEETIFADETESEIMDEDLLNNILMDEPTFIVEPEELNSDTKKDVDIENNSKNEVEEDILNINDFDFFGEEVNQFDESELQEDSESKSKAPKGMGGVFADVLSAVDSLEDDDFDLLNLIPERSNSSNHEEESSEGNGTLIKKESFIQKLLNKFFHSNKNKEETDNGDSEKSDQKEKASKTKKQKKKQQAPEPPKETEVIDVKKSKDAAKAAKKAEKEEKAKAKKAEKEEKTKAKKEIKEKQEKEKQIKKEKKLAEDIYDPNDYAPVSKIAVAFILTIAIVFVVFVVVGTNVYSYSQYVANAQTNFDHQNYEEAYEEIYGLNLKEADQVIYDKIMTVMYVNKQLNSFESYYTIEKYPEALDSLLKGLRKYDKHILQAQELGIDKHLVSIKDKILVELKEKFDINEEDAIKINSIENQMEYSIEVYDTIFEKMK